MVRQFSSSPSKWNSIHQRPSGDSSTSGENLSSSSSKLPTSEDFLSQAAESSSHSQPKVTPYDIDAVKQRLREWTDHAALTFRTRADDFTASTKVTFSQLGSQLNKVTGYEVIEALKRDVVEQGVYYPNIKLRKSGFICGILEARINATRQAAREAKTAYDDAVTQRSHSQREVNDLLQRKSNWSDDDVSRFTTLVRQDHLYEQEEARAKAAVEETENAVEREFSELMRSILARYHEEQVWSDKIRSASTYGSLAVLGLNMLVFVMAIVVVEPWKRRRLAQTFEKKIEELSLENEARLDASMKEIGAQLADQERLIIQFAQEVSQNFVSVPPTKEVIREVARAPEDGDIKMDLRTVDFQATRWGLALVATNVVTAGVVGWLWLAR